MSTGSGLPTDARPEDLGARGAVISVTPTVRRSELPELRLPDASGVLQYEEFVRPIAADAARAVVARRSRLDGGRRARLDQLVRWPLRVVVDEAGRAVGLVAAEPPSRFRFPARLPSGAVRMADRTAQHLFVDPAVAARTGLVPPDEERRLELCAALAETIAVLHGPDLDVVVGMLDGTAVLFDDATPAVLLVGTAVVHEPARPALPAPLCPAWRPAGRTSRQTDTAALALFVVRCLGPGPGRSVARSAGAAADILGPDGTDLLARALHGQGTRPTALDWLRVLTVRCGRSIEPPRVTSAEPSRTVVAAGKALTIKWTADQATTIDVHAPGCAPQRTAVRSGRGEVEVRPTRTGPVVVIARNTHGEHRLETRPVGVFDVAPTQPLLLPQVVVPDPPPLPELPRSMTDVPTVAAWPAAETSTPRRPALPPPPLFGVGSLACPLDLTALLTSAPEPQHGKERQ